MPVIPFARHRTLSLFSPAALATMRRAFASFLPQRLSELQRSWANVTDAETGALEGTIALAHRLSESAASYGYPELSERAGALRAALHDGLSGADGWRARVEARLVGVGLAVWEVCFLAD